MKQTLNAPETILRSIRTILDYLWEDEWRDYKTCSDRGESPHIFEDLRLVHGWLVEQAVCTRGDPPIANTVNKHRADAASAALDAYMQAKGIDGDPCPQSWNETMIDLLTDLRHLSAALGIDFSGAARISEYHYEEEA